MAYSVRITRDAIRDIYTFYGNTVIKYPNTWTAQDAIVHADAVIDEIVNAIINGLNGQRTPLLTALRTNGTAELYTNDRRWYYSVRLENEFAIIENAVYKSNESNRAYRRGRVNPIAPLFLDDRRNQGRIATPSTTSVPPRIKILKGTYYNGLRIAYCNHRYTIVNADGNPITNKWFDKKPKFFKKPFGKYSIIAHVSYYKSLFAIGIDGQTYDMHRLWNDAYLKEIYEAVIKSLITEVINSYLRNNLLLAG